MQEKTTPETRRAVDHMKLAAMPDIQAELADWKFITYRETGGRRILEIMKGPEGPAALTVTAMPDRTVRVLNNGVETNGNLTPDEGTLGICAKNCIKAALIAHTLTNMPGGPPSTGTLFSSSLSGAADDATYTIWEEIRDRKQFPQWVKQEDERNLDFVTSHLITNKEISWLTSQLKYGRDKPSSREYNAVAINLEVIKEAEESAPNVLRYYLNQIANSHTEPVKLAHAGEIISAVKEATGLSGSQWKTFTKIPYEAWEQRENAAMSTTAMSRICHVFAQANTAIKSKERAINLIAVLGRPINLRMLSDDMEWSHGDPRQPWANLTREYLPLYKSDSFMAYDHAHRQAEHIADAIRDTVSNNQPWGKGNWETLVKRADNWAADRNRRQQRESVLRAQRIAETKWESLIDATCSGDYTFRAVTTGQGLMDLGEEMNNCLANFYTHCKNGDTRIFEVRREDALVAAVELHQSGNGWEVGQMEGPRRSACPRKVKTGANELRDRYNEAARWEQFRGQN